MPFISSSWQHQFVKTNQIQLHCVTQGEGELVLLLHGFPEFWYSWRHQLPALARHFKVVAPDLRGYNDSDKPGQGYDLETLSADIRGLIDTLGYQRAHIVGHDWGGIIAWHLAQTSPRYLNRLAVLNAPHPYQLLRELTGWEQLHQSLPTLAFQLSRVPEWLLQRNPKNFIGDLFQKQAVRKAAFTPETLQIYQAALDKGGILSSAVSYYRQLLSPQALWRNFVHSPQPVTVPTLMLWAEEDPIFSLKLVAGLEQLISAPFRLKFVSHCGHWIQQEAPQVVNRELLSFLRQPPKSCPARLGIVGA